MGGGKSQRTGQRSVHRMFSKKPPDAGNLLAAGPIYMDVQADSATVNGVVNRMGDFLVLLTDDGTYQVFDFGEDVDQGRLEEGNSVTVTYTGELGSEDPVPVAVSVEKTDAV